MKVESKWGVMTLSMEKSSAKILEWLTWLKGDFSHIYILYLTVNLALHYKPNEVLLIFDWMITYISGDCHEKFAYEVPLFELEVRLCA